MGHEGNAQAEVDDGHKAPLPPSLSCIFIFNHGIKAISERAAIMLWIRASRSIVVVFEYCHGMAMPPTQSQRSLNR